MRKKMLIISRYGQEKAMREDSPRDGQSGNAAALGQADGPRIPISSSNFVGPFEILAERLALRCLHALPILLRIAEGSKCGSMQGRVEVLAAGDAYTS